MMSVDTTVVNLGSLTLLNAFDDKPLKALDDFQCVFRPAGSDDWFDCRWPGKFDGLGRLRFCSIQPSLDLTRAENDSDYELMFTLNAPGYTSATHEFTITDEVWSALETAIKDASATTEPLFSESVELTPLPVAAQVSVFDADNNPVDGEQFSVVVTTDTETQVGNRLGTLAIWSFAQLPTQVSVTVAVKDSDGQTVGESLHTVNYAQPVNAWEVTLAD